MKKCLLVIIIFLPVSVFAEIANPENFSNNTKDNIEYTTLLIAILTVLSSGVVAACVSHRLAKSKEELFYRRKKLEELYKCIDQYTTLLFRMNHMWLKVMDGELDFNQGLDLQIESNNDDDKLYLPEIDMLINLYFPNFLPTYRDFIERRNSVNILYANFKETYKLKGPTVDYSNICKEFSKALLEIDNASKTLLEEVAKYAQKLN